ncbi:J domain-containing protein [Sphingomonas jaspsi]|uniref:J domain-containing protein n=1 Tax=Sphingomonas jaspsi TaxID=392409 RepID=UPI00056B7E66|nr:DnaJ domain-containing protein [Sphingomonas jaspsi]
MDAYGDYYATLRVAADADGPALRRAYRELMRRYHPDVTVDADAEQRCRAINEAYACLRDPAQRALYDRQRIARRHRRGHATSRVHSTRPVHPANAAYAALAEEELAKQSRLDKSVAIGLGILVTILTFAATSAVDLPPRAADPGTVTQVQVRPDTARR